MKRFRLTQRFTRRQIIVFGAGVVVLLALVLLFLPDAVPVSASAAARGPLQVVVEEEGETRVADRYVVTAPVAAFARRIELEVGDMVEAGQPVVRLEPPRAAILDPRAQAEAAARVASARATLAEADVAAAQATAELARVERLHAAGAATRQALEQATAAAARALATRDAARAELNAALAAQRTAAGPTTLPVEGAVRAPASGRVLVVHHESAGHVNPGDPLIEIGETARLQVRSEVLSQDAVRITPGMRVVLEQWGGPVSLEAVVTQVDPQGFTRVSALGVEERRVRVLADITSPAADYAGLGPGYRVLARFVLWEQPNVLQVPAAAVFRHGDGWAVFVIERGRARLRHVELGQRAGLVTEIRSGVQEGEVVIVHPGNDVDDGVRVSVE